MATSSGISRSFFFPLTLLFLLSFASLSSSRSLASVSADAEAKVLGTEEELDAVLFDSGRISLSSSAISPLRRSLLETTVNVGALAEGDLTLLPNSAKRGAVCLDGTPPAYYFKPGFDDGATKWIVYLEGGAWCDSEKDCFERSKGFLGGTKNLARKRVFQGILSMTRGENPYFYNWNKVYLYYCDGASFMGNATEPLRIEGRDVYFAGARVYDEIMGDLLKNRGMRNATDAILVGCSSGALAALLHCNDFKKKFYVNQTRVRCISDGGVFVDFKDISGTRHRVREIFQGIQKIHQPRLMPGCLAERTPDKAYECLFPENFVHLIKAPQFYIQSMYDKIQMKTWIVPDDVDPEQKWEMCKFSVDQCQDWQYDILNKYYFSTMGALRNVDGIIEIGMFLDSCHTHCQVRKPWWWHNPTSPRIGGATVAEAVADWYFEKIPYVHFMDCMRPCQATCPDELARDI